MYAWCSFVSISVLAYLPVFVSLFLSLLLFSFPSSLVASCPCRSIDLIDFASFCSLVFKMCIQVRRCREETTRSEERRRRRAGRRDENMLEQCDTNYGASILVTQCDANADIASHIHRIALHHAYVYSLTVYPSISVSSPLFRFCLLQRDPYNWSEDMYELYSHSIQDYLDRQVSPALIKVRSQHDVALMQEWTKRWANHKLVVKGLKKLFQYLDRFYTPVRGRRTEETRREKERKRRDERQRAKRDETREDETARIKQSRRIRRRRNIN